MAQSTLYKLLKEHFTEDELQDIHRKLQMRSRGTLSEVENSDFIWQLILHCHYYKCLPKLLEQCQELRPDKHWPHQGTLYITSDKAAQQMQKSVDLVRKMCKEDPFFKKIAEKRGRNWYILEDGIEKWAEENRKQIKNKLDNSFTAKVDQHGKKLAKHWFFVVSVGIIIPFVVLYLDKNWPSPTPVLLPPTVTSLPFSTEQPDEILIVIATFHTSNNVDDTEPYNKIAREIRRVAEDLQVSNLRIIVEPQILDADDRQGAEKLAHQYGASMVVWGEYTGVEVVTNFLNLREPTILLADERFSFRNPNRDTSIIFEDLPSGITFLTFFTLGRLYTFNGEYNRAIYLIERAVAPYKTGSLLPPEEITEGIGQAYFLLGWLHQITDNTEQAKVFYTLAIKLCPKCRVDIYWNQGILQSQQGNQEFAGEQFLKSAAEAMNADGMKKYSSGSLEDAEKLFTRAIEICPTLIEAYMNRGDLLFSSRRLDEALDDFSKVIEFDTNLALAYYKRGQIYLNKGQFEEARDDFLTYLRYDSNSSNRNLVDKLIPQLEEKIDEQYSDLAKGYLMQGLVQMNEGDMASAIVSLQAYLFLEPEAANRQTIEKYIELLRAESRNQRPSDSSYI